MAFPPKQPTMPMQQQRIGPTPQDIAASVMNSTQPNRPPRQPTKQQVPPTKRVPPQPGGSKYGGR